MTTACGILKVVVGQLREMIGADYECLDPVFKGHMTEI